MLSLVYLEPIHTELAEVKGSEGKRRKDKKTVKMLHGSLMSAEKVVILQSKIE